MRYAFVLMLQAVIFDVDGTLIDSVDAHAHSWTETLRDFGYEVGFDDVRHQIGKGGDQLMAEFLSKEEIAKDGEAIEKARKELFQKEYLPDVEAFPKTRELFERFIDAGCKVALASSANGEELEAYKEKADIADLVDSETSKDDAEKSKPHPDIFEAAMERLPDIPKSDIIVIGDSPWDAIAAQKAGLRSLGVLCGGFAEKDLREAGFSEIYQDPAHLLRKCEDIMEGG